MKRFLIITLACILIAGTVLGAGASSPIKTKDISATEIRYSWVGIKVIELTVKGWYDADGIRVVKFNNTTAEPKTFLTWSSSQRASWWTSTTNTKQAQCYGQTKFTLGISTKEASFGIQSLVLGVTATGNPSLYY